MFNYDDYDGMHVLGASAMGVHEQRESNRAKESEQNQKREK